MKEVFHHFDTADSTTLAIFDIDLVLVQPSNPAFQMPNVTRHLGVARAMLQELSREQKTLLYSLMTINSDAMLIDSSTPQLLQQLHKKGVPSMALTANLTGEFSTVKSMEKWRVATLKRLSVDFSVSAPAQTPITFDNLAKYRSNPSTYLDGILFTNGTAVSKGEAFLSFLDKTKLSPTKVIFIDDVKENLTSLESALQKHSTPIEYHGIHFTGANNYPSKLISEEEFTCQWEKIITQVKEL